MCNATSTICLVRNLLIVTAACVLLSAVSASPSGATPIILVSTDDVIHRFSTAGELSETIPIPYPGGLRPVTESARDLVASGQNLFLYNGTFDPSLSTYDTASDTWTHTDHAGWSTVNNATYGGIATIGSLVFATDMDTGDAQGIVRFDTFANTSIRFAQDIGPIDLTIGLDELLYALYPGSSGGTNINVYGLDGDFLRQIELASSIGAQDIRAIAVAANGQIFAASFSGTLFRLDALGGVINSTTLLCEDGLFICNLYDVDLFGGTLAVGSRFGDVLVTDVTLSSVTSFSVGSQGTFVAFVIPEPAPALLIGAGLIGLAFGGRRRGRA